jgi:hypothetical protein
VVASLLSDYGEGIAEMYTLHNGIESYKAALQYQQHCETLGYEHLADDEMETLKSEYDQLRNRFGSDYCNPYGWAAHTLDKKNPRFSDLEKAAGLEHLRPFYKLASHNVHANPKEAFHKMGLFSWEADLLLAGPSFAGLADPGQSTAISLDQITVTLLTSAQPNIDRLVLCKILLDLQEKISAEFIRG